MWESLRISSLGVIEDAELDFGPGFNVLTGETGAGKTMVVSALGLLRGQRADAALVRRGSDKARVEAVIAADELSQEAAEAVAEAGGDANESIILTRSIQAEGRSRATAGGVTVPAGLLSELTGELVTVHGQSDQHRLLHGDQQRRSLDRLAGTELEKLLVEYRPIHERLKQVRLEIDNVTRNAVERQRELDFLRHGLAEYDQVAPDIDEDKQLLADERRLAHAESLVRAAAGAADLISDADNAATDTIANAVELLTAVAGNDAELDAHGERVNAALIELADVASELHRYGSTIDVDPARLASVQERRAAIGGLQRRFGPTLSDVHSWAEGARARTAELSSDEETTIALEAELATLTARRNALAARISDVRTAAAVRLSEAVTAELDALHMASASLDVRVSPVEPGADGADSVEFWFTANSGSPLRPMAKSASGGELSRLMLALEVVIADTDPVPTLVFDEIDAGIGGRAAVEVGRRLQRLARHAQVLAVTHLPQVAAFADSHFTVAKADDGTITRSSVVKLDEEARIDELARMLAGVDDSASAREHARELLGLAHD